MRIRRVHHFVHFAAAVGLFIVFLMTGTVWVLIVRVFAPGAPRAAAVLTLAVAFVGLFLWLLVQSVERIYRRPKRRNLETIVSVGYLLLLLLAFASVYQRIGIIDNTEGRHRIVTEFWPSLYFSVITFTTVGYGDFYPVGVGRALAGLEGLTGYLVLALLASTVASVLQTRSRNRAEDAKESERADLPAGSRRGEP